MATIDNLAIQVTASADEASRALNRLASGCERLRNAASNVAGALRDMANGEREVADEAQLAASSIDRMTRAQERLNRAMNSANGSRHSSTMRNVQKDTDAATNSLTRFANALTYVGMTWRDVFSRLNNTQMNNQFNNSTPLLGGQVGTIYTDFIDAAESANEAATEIRNAGEQAGNSERTIGRFGRALEEAGRSARRSTSGISMFWQSLKRIAYYRFIRFIIKEITDAFKEGIKNLYHWSSAINGRFAKSMDRIATSTLYLKNSLGAMLAPIINTLTPVIEWIIDRIVDVINWINKLFAALSGSQTYTVAKKVATKWDDTSKSVKKTSDDVKRTILGFDEINKLQKETSSSSGSKKKQTDYTRMFEERKLDGWMLKLSTWISDFKAQIPATLAAILVPFEAIKKVVQAIAKKTKEWVEDLANLGKRAIEVPVSLVRKGWKTITDWCKSFGVATLSVAVAISTTAQKLWNGLKVAWGSLPNQVLSVYLTIATTAKSLWQTLKVAWGSIPNAALNVYLSIATSAKSLWTSLQVAWGSLPNLALNVYLKLATAAKDLWTSLKVAWGSLESSVLNVYLSLATTAKSLWTSLQVAWGSITGLALNVYLKLATTAKSLWTSLQTEWGAIQNHVLSVYLDLATTAKSLWTSLQVSWGKIKNHVLSVYLSLVTTAETLWGDLQTAWNGIADRVLGVSVVLTPIAKSLWTKLQTAWNGISEKVLGINVKIGTALKPLWEGLKLNWEKLALGALGIAVAIVTPWETIAAALGGLWGNVLGSFGGALGFAVAPILNKTPGEIQKELQEQMKPISPVIVYSTMAYKSVESAVGDTVNVVVKAVNAAGTELKNSWDLISNGLKWSLEVPMLINGEPGTGFIDHLSGTNKYTLSGITDANVTVNGKYNKAGSSPEANAALSGGSFDKKVSMSFDTSGLTSSYGDFTVDDSGITGATSSITGLINAFNAIKDGAKKILKVGVQSDGTPDLTTSTALTFKSGLKKALRVSVAKSGSINSTVGNAVDAPSENYKTVNVGIGADSKNSDSTAVKAVQNIGKTVKLSISAVITSLLGATSAIAQFFGIGKKTALGGIFSNGIWSNIPQYAGGTTNAHGSLFMAGEAGPEIVGHIGGRTEVLNKSQLAATMYSAVRNAMSGVTLDANFYGDAGGGLDYDTMFKAMYDAFTAALAQSNERDREKVALLRTISEKEFTAEVSTASINQAQTRMNRRAGTTIVAVGT